VSGRSATSIGPADITIVVPTKNESQNIVGFLRTLPAAVRLVVVDSSDDDTVEVIERVRPQNTTVIKADANIPQARQIGAQAAETPWLLFSDADVIMDPAYFTNLAGIELRPDDAGLYGAKATLGGFDVYHRWFTRGQALFDRIGVPAASGSNMIVSTAALASVGGFDPRLSVNEDTELMFRIRRAGYGVRFDRSLVVHSIDQRRLELGIARKVAHGAIRNTALYLGVFGPQVRQSDWGYWTHSASSASPSASQSTARSVSSTGSKTAMGR
jgi:GT2 family glycosyltransferase